MCIYISLDTNKMNIPDINGINTLDTSEMDILDTIK